MLIETERSCMELSQLGEVAMLRAALRVADVTINLLESAYGPLHPILEAQVELQRELYDLAMP